MVEPLTQILLPDEATGAVDTVSSCSTAHSEPGLVSISHHAHDSKTCVADEYHVGATGNEAIKESMAKLLNGKEQEWAAVAEKSGPLNLLDLPLDILKEIVKEVTHTNDLTSLALCHSALHDLAIPHIYSRFDIVWPDATTHVEPRSGVDALTYGLATLVFGEEIFGEAPNQQLLTCTYCGRCNDRDAPHTSATPEAHSRPKKRRRGNHYAQYTRKFSLGNGPPDWVQEYLISKEGGKMLGTLVAVAVARMHNLETFIWDMPTGVLRDVWMALASLGDQGEDNCKLERIWIRWHDNFQLESSSSIPAIAIPPNVGLPPPNITHHSGAGQTFSPVNNSSQSAIGAGFDRVEHPTFSVLPRLKSLSVLDIDELPYLEEMSILIGKSKKCLRELRVGIASHAQDRHWTALWDGENSPLSTGTGNSIPFAPNTDKRLGGVLGVLVGKFYDIRQRTSSQSLASFALHQSKIAETLAPATPAASDSDNLEPSTSVLRNDGNQQAEESVPSPSNSSTYVTASPHSSPEKSSVPHFIEDLPSSGIASIEISVPGVALPSNELHSETNNLSSEPPKTPTAKTVHWLSNSHESPLRTKSSVKFLSDLSEDAPEDSVLALRILELERVPLSVPVLQMALDWSKLTDLTILDCQNYEQLWKALRRTFTPVEEPPRARSSPKSSKGTRQLPLEYRLKLRKLHTNVVSSSLISFLKETLAPNSLEILFLQDSRTNATSVTVDAIFRGPLRRHRASLKKLSIDSSEKAVDGRPITNSRWRKWILNRDILGFICGGKMSSLRELGMAIEYRDWHYFLQRLPQIPHIRSLYIPYIADHAHGNNIDSRELALQIVDIVTLRPDIELCYMGIGSKCFEILEMNAKGDTRFDADGLDLNDGDHEYSDDEEVNDTHGNDIQDDLDDPAVETTDEHEETEDESFDSRHEHEEPDDDYVEDEKPATRLKLREILFYDDKVAIFKARHGRL